MFEEEKKAFSDSIYFITISIVFHTTLALIRFVLQYMVYDPNAEINEMILKLESAIFDWVIVVIIVVPKPPIFGLLSLSNMFLYD